MHRLHLILLIITRVALLKLITNVTAQEQIPPTNVCGSGTGIIISANSIIWIKCTCTLSVCVGSDLLISLVEVNGNPVSCGCSVSGSNPNGTYPASACSNTPSPTGTIIWNLTGTTFN